MNAPHTMECELIISKRRAMLTLIEAQIDCTEMNLRGWRK